MEKHQVAKHQVVIQPVDTERYSRESLRALNPFGVTEVNGDVLSNADILDATGSVRDDYAELYEDTPYIPSHPEPLVDPIDLERMRILKEVDAWDKLYDRYGDTAHSDDEARARTEAKLGPRPELPATDEQMSGRDYAGQIISQVNERYIGAATTESERSLRIARAVGRATKFGSRT